MKLIIILAVILLSGCSTRQLMCAGTGTCFGDERDSQQITGTSLAPAQNTRPQQILLPNGSYTIIRNSSTAQPMAIVRTSKTK